MYFEENEDQEREHFEHFKKRVLPEFRDKFPNSSELQLGHQIKQQWQQMPLKQQGEYIEELETLKSTEF